jgi:hypothetical protein
MREYKMRRGEQLDERLPDMKATVEGYFGPVTDSEEYSGSDLFVIEEPENPVFERIVVGRVAYAGKKDALAVEFAERDPDDLAPEDLEAAGEAVSLKNDFLLEATGRDAKGRRESMKNDVQDADTPDNV